MPGSGRIDSETLRQASQDITDFGAAVSDQDADQIRTVGDAIDQLGLVWLGLTNQLTVAVAPALESVASALAETTRAGGVFQTSISFLEGTAAGAIRDGDGQAFLAAWQRAEIRHRPIEPGQICQAGDQPAAQKPGKILMDTSRIDE